MLLAGAKILLFLYCSGFKAQSSQVRVLWEDHRNDIFINGFGSCAPLFPCMMFGIHHGPLGLVMSAGGSKWVWCKHSTIPSSSIPTHTRLFQGSTPSAASSYVPPPLPSPTQTNLTSRSSRWA